MSRGPAIYPLPEAVKRKRYEVIEGRGHCDNKNGVMAVPLDGSPASRRVIAHETAHARWSPRILKRPRSIPESAVQRAEDLRMNLLTVRAGAGDALMPPLADNERSVDAFYAAFCGNRHSTYTAALALVNTGDYDRFMQVALAVNPVYAIEAMEVAASAWAAMDAIESPEWEDTLRLAAKVTELARERNEAEREPPPEEEEPEEDPGESPDEGEGEEITFEPPPPTEDEDGEGQSEAGPEEQDEDESAGGGGIPEEDDEDDEGEPEDEDDEGDTESSGSDGGEEDAEEDEDEDKAGVGDTEAEEESAASDGGGTDGGKAGDSEAAESGDESEDGESKDESDGDGDPEASGEAGDTGDASEEYEEDGVDPLDLDDIELDDDEATERMSTHDGFMEAARAIPEKEVDDVEAAVREMIERCSGAGSGPGPGTMSIVTPPLVKRLPARMIGKSRSAATEGTAPRWMNRYCTDGAIFGGRAKRPGTGTVVFDTSGSMSLTSEDVQELMQKLPAGTIAAYSGSGTYGQLRILAKGGRRVDDKDVRVPGCGNIVDVPALEWLAKQAEPRLWVCDGVVTGKNDRFSRGVVNACARICREAKILRLPSMRDLELWLEKTKKVDKKRGGR